MAGVSISADNLLTLTVDDLRTECPGVITLSLIDHDGQALPPWQAGAHVDLHLAEGMVRQYSLCGDPADTSRYVVAVLRDPHSRGGSAFIHDHVKKGSKLPVSLPRNHFALRDASRYLFIAGGIGITPIIPMMTEARRRGSQFRLHYAGRSRSSMAFLDVLGDQQQLTLHVSDEATRLDLRAALPDAVSADTAIYACGPQRLLDNLAECCTALGLSKNLHVEHFSAASTELDPSTERCFEVELSRSKRLVPVLANQTILDAVKACGIKAASSCAEGVCGSCETKVLAGEVDHRDQILDADERAENTVMMICCSRAKCDRLVLDL